MYDRAELQQGQRLPRRLVPGVPLHEFQGSREHSVRITALTAGGGGGSWCAVSSFGKRIAARPRRPRETVRDGRAGQWIAWDNWPVTHFRGLETRVLPGSTWTHLSCRCSRPSPQGKPPRVCLEFQPRRKAPPRRWGFGDHRSPESPREKGLGGRGQPKARRWPFLKIPRAGECSGREQAGQMHPQVARLSPVPSPPASPFFPTVPSGRHRLVTEQQPEAPPHTHSAHVVTPAISPGPGLKGGDQPPLHAVAP